MMIIMLTDDDGYGCTKSVGYLVSAIYLCVTIPPAVRPTLVRLVEMGSLTCAHIVRACRTHEEGSGTSKSAQPHVTLKDRKTTVPHPAPPGDRTLNGLRNRQSDALNTVPCPPSVCFGQPSDPNTNRSQKERGGKHTYQAM